MIYPSLSSLLEKTDNTFTLVIVVAKRAKQLVNGAQKLTKYISKKPITIATNEVNENMITYIRTKSGIK
jgi:DNA-directed RNA polymerase subunit omega